MARQKRIMTAEHKAAIASGRAEGTVVRRYLEALHQKGKPGRRIDPERAAEKLTEIEGLLQDEDNPLARLELHQQKLDLSSKVASLGEEVDISGLEQEFIRVGKRYARRKSISYAAFRHVGVPSQVLRETGISRGE